MTSISVNSSNKSVDYGKLRIIRSELKEIRNSVNHMLDNLDLHLDDGGDSASDTESDITDDKGYYHHHITTTLLLQW